ncbi:MAG: DUF2336 domain-containing protein [Xanthobacteraceae bacterium]
MISAADLFSELEHAIAQGSADRRAEMARHVGDLFTTGGVRYSDDEIALFDQILVRLVAEIEQSARALLAARLAPLASAPPELMRILACDDAIEVACPVLAQSERLDEPTIVATARTKSQQHLLAISRRKSLSEAVTDVLVDRGNREVLLSATENAAARFSEHGFSTLVTRSDGDDELAARVGSRRDVPMHLFLKLLAKASETVRARLEAENPNATREIHRVVAEVARRVRAEHRAGARDYAAAQTTVGKLHESSRLDVSTLEHFIEAGQVEESTVALARLADLPIEAVDRMMGEERPDRVLIVAKAVGLSWPTTKAFLRLRAKEFGFGESDIEQCLASFERLKLATAEQLLRFQRQRERKTG